MGELEVRGPWVASSYFGSADQHDKWTDDGFFRTGDVATIDGEGYLRITDRTKDLIKSGGEWISSIDLEEEIAALPGVAQAAVVAVADPRWEERPLAIVVSSDGRPADYPQLRSLLADRVAKFMVPEYWTQLDDLPKTSVGKIDKQRLRTDARCGALPFVKETGLRNLAAHE